MLSVDNDYVPSAFYVCIYMQTTTRVSSSVSSSLLVLSTSCVGGGGGGGGASHIYVQAVVKILNTRVISEGV